ncbi:hypothetical protein phiAS5_ORF0078 [Aeromonas phage phiAS5]|uniref:Uncharacterized protein n=1 Tax=Aeromonas phage phiAS5 TaxID=879630 RepID=E1A2H5_9CAUD|nr:hypothetical protein phiAS5_ORF0078 [Aeromonas phage phiAS5]ADM79921.1 hypothetical protein phiAS5_ORF0078 [Aeromonas phage phiAS5]BES53307.1 hypothetical protein [Aeromonas phage phiWae14]
MLHDTKLLTSGYGEIAEFSSIYPPLLIIEPGMKDKVERQIMQSFEPMYSLSNQTLSEMRSAWRELAVCYHFAKNIKPEYVMKAAGVFAAHMDFVCLVWRNLPNDQWVKSYLKNHTPPLMGLRDKSLSHESMTFTLLQDDLGRVNYHVYFEAYNETQIKLLKRMKK